MTQRSLEKEDEIKESRLDYLYPERKKKNEKSNGEKDAADAVDSSGFDLDGDWGDDDDDDDDAIKANKQRQEEKEKLAEEVARASGKSDQMMKRIKVEGIDEGVLGQKWVERTLTGYGQWPPKSDLSILKELDTNPALRRNLCMTMGRVNSQFLNTNPELVAAGPKQLIDNLYFQSSMEYRKRTIVLLEAALRMVGSTRSYRLYKKIVECYTMFKIGTPSIDNKIIVDAFQQQMEKVFGPKGVPRIIISTLEISTPDEKEIVTGDNCALELEMHRVHGESFMKQKIETAMKQGIPPQVALQAFREGWWILLRCEKLDGGNDDNDEKTDFIDKNIIFANLSSETKDKFKQEKGGNRLINAWPFMVSNMKQNVGKVKVRFLVPNKPGKYKFYIDVKSQEYIGCDQTFTLEKEVLDKETVVRAEKKEEEEKGASPEEEEPKKTK